MFAGDTPTRTLIALFLPQPVLHASMAGILLHVIQHPYGFLNWAPVAWLGQISYSLYLWQQPFCYSPSLRSPYFTVFGLLCACASYYCVERPMLRLREHRSLIRGAARPEALRAATAA